MFLPSAVRSHIRAETAGNSNDSGWAAGLTDHVWTVEEVCALLEPTRALGLILAELAGEAEGQTPCVS